MSIIPDRHVFTIIKETYCDTYDSFGLGWEFTEKVGIIGVCDTIDIAWKLIELDVEMYLDLSSADTKVTFIDIPDNEQSAIQDNKLLCYYGLDIRTEPLCGKDSIQYTIERVPSYTNL